MDFKVDYNLLDELGSNIIKEDENLVNLFSELLKIIKELNNGWVGPDCENFQIISSNYIKDLEKVTNEIDYIATYMRKAASSYSENDNNWKETVSRIGEDQDEYR